MAFRNTFIFALEDAVWRIVHIHNSNPKPSIEAMGYTPRSIEELTASLQSEALVLGHTGIASVMFTDIVDSTALAAATGDTAWTEALIPLAQGADLLVIECHGFRTPVPGHLTHRDLVRHGDALRAKRIVCTHLGEEALAHRADFAFEVAEDGMELRIGA